MLFTRRTHEMPTAETALPGRDRPMPVPDRHFVNGHPLTPPFPEGYQQAVFALGCFWGAEKDFWRTPGVWTTAAGYAGGFTPNPTYDRPDPTYDRPDPTNFAVAVLHQRTTGGSRETDTSNSACGTA